MTQFQFDSIVAIIKSGAPALAPELLQVFSEFVKKALETENELNALKKAAEAKDAIKEESAAEEA